jgi:hypothetical protein
VADPERQEHSQEMLFSRRKRATAVEPVKPAVAKVSEPLPEVGSNDQLASPTPRSDGRADGRAGGDAPSARAAPANDPTDWVLDAASPMPIAGAAGAPTVPVAAPRASAPAPDANAGGSGPAPDEESGDTDLDRFFAALRQVVHDARERVVLDRDGEPANGAAATEDPRRTPAPEPAPATAPAAAGATRSAGAVVPTQAHPVNGTESAPSPELAPTTSELIASLEADRDLWRERAVVWRERAMGADMLVKTLNAHMSDLKINLEDLRLAMRVLDREAVDAPEPRAELPAPGSRWSGVDRYLEPGA